MKRCSVVGNVLPPDIRIAHVTRTVIIQSLEEHVERLPCVVFSVSLTVALFEQPTETQVGDSIHLDCLNKYAPEARKLLEYTKIY